jgi:prevent-host-death family protein
MDRLSVADARAGFSDALNRVAFGRERIVIHRHGRDVAALIPLEDLRRLGRLLAEAADRLDAVEAGRRLADASDEAVPYEESRRRLGIGPPRTPRMPKRKPRPARGARRTGR